MTTGSIVPLAARIDSSARAVRCASCPAIITSTIWRRGALHAAFSGEWREGDDKVWRLTDYARHQRKRRDSGRDTTAQGWHRRNWAEPKTWGVVVRARPCWVECPDCGEAQVIG